MVKRRKSFDEIDGVNAAVYGLRSFENGLAEAVRVARGAGVPWSHIQDAAGMTRSRLEGVVAANPKLSVYARREMEIAVVSVMLGRMEHEREEQMIRMITHPEAEFVE